MAGPEGMRAHLMPITTMATTRTASKMMMIMFVRSELSSEDDDELPLEPTAGVVCTVTMARQISPLPVKPALQTQLRPARPAPSGGGWSAHVAFAWHGVVVQALMLTQPDDWGPSSSATRVASKT